MHKRSSRRDVTRVTFRIAFGYGHRVQFGLFFISYFCCSTPYVTRVVFGADRDGQKNQRNLLTLFLSSHSFFYFLSLFLSSFSHLIFFK